mgnify:CR=1 FL=1|tara:strand:- start:3274 stop:3975 length:702 start_codon:yes stop_codon:yes gene_type:complete
MMPRIKTQLLLFDIDGTLLLSGGAGKRALNRAFKESFGASDGFDSIPVAGRTDELIFRDALKRAGKTATASCRHDFFSLYYKYLEQEIVHPGRNKGLMPGVRLLLDRLSPLSNVVIGLLTGNFAAAAKIKLQYFGIWDYFVFGAYGDDAPVRDDLVPIAVSRARASDVAISSNVEVIVVGDTPLDVRCAIAGGARSVAVCTGSYGEYELQEAGADSILPDLTDPERFLRLILE